MDIKKRKWGEEEFHKNEKRYVIEAALIGGVFAGMLMNSFECIMYLKMAELESSKSILQIYKERGLSLFTKGLQTRIMMSSGYAMIQLNTLYYIGKLFNVDLLDELDEQYLESLPVE
jgi:hypothetical protein